VPINAAPAPRTAKGPSARPLFIPRAVTKADTEAGIPHSYLNKRKTEVPPITRVKIFLGPGFGRFGTTAAPRDGEILQSVPACRMITVTREMEASVLTTDITVRLAAWRGGDLAALEPVMPELYDLLRQIAVQRLRGEADSATLDPTDLVHEAMARLLSAGKAFANRTHFLAVSALYMRSILVDRARAILAGRRPGEQATITLGSAAEVADDLGAMDVVVLDEALRQLEALEPRAAAAMELAAFAGMDRAEIAQTLDVSVPTIDRDLRFARAFVNRALTE